MSLFLDAYPDAQTSFILRKPGYYDSPEGTNPWEKLWGMNKYAISASIGVAIGDILFVTQAKNAIQCANVFGFWMVPSVGLATAFASVTYIAANARGKDDRWNYACGVLACAPVLHAWRKSTDFTMSSLGFLMIIAIMKKQGLEKGWIFFPDPPQYTGSYHYDFSMTKEWPRRPL